MKLAQYLKSTGISASALARQINVEPSTIARIARGDVQPHWKTAQAITKATGGAVMANDFMEDAPPDDKKSAPS